MKVQEDHEGFEPNRTHQFVVCADDDNTLGENRNTMHHKEKHRSSVRG